jgi:arginyl-tRNA synthetase
MNIGDSIYRIVNFCGADIIRDNHIGDGGTQFGILIMVIREKGYVLPTYRWRRSNFYKSREVHWARRMKHFLPLLG